MCFRRWFKRYRLDLLNPEELKEVQVLSQQHQQQLQAGQVHCVSHCPGTTPRDPDPDFEVEAESYQQTVSS